MAWSRVPPKRHFDGAAALKILRNLANFRKNVPDHFSNHKHSAAELAAKAILAGEVIAYPTEGVWGLGCAPCNFEAVKKILTLKQRPASKGLILLAGSRAQLGTFVERPPEFPEINHATTWLVEHGGRTPDWISGGNAKVAVRITKHPLVVDICAKVGAPIVSTSANPAGEVSAESPEQVRKYFGDLIDFIVPGALGGQAGASQIIDWETKEVIRKAEA